jgi:hypothetical protein
MQLQQLAEEVAADVVLQLVVDGHILVSPLSVPPVERRVAIILREVLLQKDERRRLERLVRERGELGLDPGVLSFTTLPVPELRARRVPRRAQSVGGPSGRDATRAGSRATRAGQEALASKALNASPP